jgi:NAD(P)H-hydrate epimerase
MKRTISVKETQAFDRFAQKQLGIPSVVLMENAGRGVAEEAMGMGLGTRDQGLGKVAVVCGVGNNGGDGFVAARHLVNAGYKVKVFVVGSKSKLKNDPKINLNILRKMGQGIKWVKSVKDLKGIEKCGLIIDAIFGIGLKSPVAGLYLETINYLNKTGIPILSVDVPSGLNMGTAVRPRRTVTFVAIKKGMTRANCGEIVVKDIGIAWK